MKKLFNKLPLALLLLTVGLVVIANLVWINLHQLSPYFDTSGHTILTYIFARVFSGDYPFNGIRALLTQSNYYPPLLYFIGSLVTLVFGYGYKILQGFSTLLLIPTAVLLYLYTRKITGNKLWAIFAASLFVLFPVIWEQARYYMLDLPLTMWVLAAVYSLQKSDNFKKLWPGLLFFVFAAFAQLTKWYGFVFLVIPLLYALYNGYKEAGDKEHFLIRIFKFGLVGAAIALPWYAANFSQLIKDTLFFSHAHYQNPTATLSLQNFLYYPTLMLNFQIVSVMFLWLIVSLLILIFGKHSLKKFLLLQISFSLLVFTLLGNKNVRFTMPLLPFLAMVMGYGLTRLHQASKALAYSLWIALLSFGVLFMSVTSFGMPLEYNKMHYKALVPNWDIFILLDGTSDIIPYRYRQTDWSSKTILSAISERSQKTNSLVYVGINNQYLSQPIIEVFKFEQNSAVNFATPPFDAREPLDSPEKIEEYLRQFDYLIIPKDSVGPEHHVNYQNLDEVRRYVLSGYTRTYKWVTTYQLPDGQEVYLFEKDPDYNRLQIDLVNNELFIKRPDAPTMVFFQVGDADNNWQQYSLGIHQRDFYLPLSPSVTTIRFDYPPELWSLYNDSEWKYDLDKQIDRISQPADLS